MEEGKGRDEEMRWLRGVVGQADRTHQSSIRIMNSA